MTQAMLLLFSLLSLLFGYDEAELVFAGDAMQHQAQLDAARQSDGTYDYSDCFTQLQPWISSADYAVVNLETPVGRSGFTGYPCFHAPESYVDALKNAGFDMMLTANNHTLDRRARGLRSTIEALESRNLDHVGTYATTAERHDVLPVVRDISGIKVGFLNYTYGTNGIEPSDGVVVDYIDRQLIANDVEATRKAGAEIVCVCIHWGDEYHLLPNASQRAMADYLTSLGVDLVIGGHPHVIQPMEIRDNPVTGKQTLVVYSLGNFISAMRTRDTRGGALVRVRLVRDTDGRARLDSASYLPVFTVPASGSGTNFRVMEAEAVTDPAWTHHRDEFLQAARAIFDRHNISVHHEL